MSPTPTLHVLVSSLSKKVPLIKSIRKSFHDSHLTGKIIGTDKNSEVIGRYFVDQFEYFSGLDDLNITEFIKECKRYDVKAIIPTRNAELEFYATHRNQLAQNEIYCMVSSLQSVKNCVDKLAFYDELKSDFPVIRTSLLLDFDTSRYVVKERYGAGSIDIGLNLSKEEAVEYANQLHDPIYQPYVSGQEFSIDLYINRSGEVLGTIARRRDLVVKGESQITQSVKYPDLEMLCTEMARKLRLYGHVIFQAIYDKGKLHVVECNPRFGGASTLSIAMGLRSFEWFFAEVLNRDLKEIPFKRSPEELKLVRYPEDYIFS